MITPSVAEIKQAVEEAFPTVGSLGVYNRRKIAGSSTWSQHSWGNAWDITWPRGMTTAEGQRFLDDVHAFLLRNRYRKTLPIGLILWRVKNHFDHIHVEGKPKRTGIPPIIGSGMEDEELQVKELVTEIQKALIAGGYTLPQYGADGDWGDETGSAFARMARDARNTAGVSVADIVAAIGNKLRS